MLKRLPEARSSVTLDAPLAPGDKGATARTRTGPGAVSVDPFTTNPAVDLA